jgi:DinB superfamily
MHPKLARLEYKLAEAIRNISPDELGRHREGRWSVAQILDHLNLTYLGTIRNLERSLGAGKTRATPARGRMRFERLLITRLGWFPSGRKAPGYVLPGEAPPGRITSEVIENLARMDAVISECELHFGRRQPIAVHPILGPLSAAGWRAFHYAHGRHHEKQIRRLKAGFTP